MNNRINQYEKHISDIEYEKQSIKENSDRLINKLKNDNVKLRTQLEKKKECIGLFPSLSSSQ